MGQEAVGQYFNASLFILIKVAICRTVCVFLFFFFFFEEETSGIQPYVNLQMIAIKYNKIDTYEVG